MPLRADTIEIPAGGPIGAVELGGLAACDLIVLTGPNGAGKSVLARPLETPGAAGSVGCVDELGERHDYKSKGVQQSITFVRSTDLMSRFRDLEGALALAANATRELHKARMMEQVSNTDLLKVAAGGSSPSEPETIASRRAAFIDADRRCGQIPRTRAEYRRLGSELAALKGVQWQPSAFAADVRVPNEMQVQPEHRSLAGLQDLRPALQLLESLPVPHSGQRSEADAHREAAEVLATKVAEAREQLPSMIAETSSLTPDALASKVLEGIKVARRAAEDTVAAMDALRDCKARASRYIGRCIELGQGCDACPVCDRPIAGTELKQALDAATRSDIPGADEWAQSAKQLERLEGDLTGLLKAHQKSEEAAKREHKALADAVRNALPQFQRARDWSPSVAAAADEIRRSCEDWFRVHASAFSPGASAAARALRDHARDALRKLVAEAGQLNEGLAAAQAQFQAFQRLGTLLDIREELDRAEWTLRLDEVEADRRRDAQRVRWHRVAEQMAAEFRARAMTANATVVDDHGVQDRFRRLLDRLAPSQPTLAALGFRGSSVETAGVNRSDLLSEGQTVLVNIAAAIAVAGKVAGAHDHRPGWIAFDEPTNGLDEASRDAVADYLGGMTTKDLPLQVFVTTFDVPFATRLIAAAQRSGRRVRHVELPPFKPGQAVRPIERVA